MKPRNSSNNQISQPFSHESGWPTGIHYVEIPTIQEARCFLGPRDPRVRKLRSQIYYQGKHNRARDHLRLGKHDRGEEYVWADGKIHGDDLRGQNHHFPVHVKFIHFDTYKIKADGVWDVTASHDKWPDISPREELYTYIHINRLHVEPGALIVVQGNVLVIECDEIILEKIGQPTIRKGFSIQLLGTPYPGVSYVRSEPAVNGADGVDGSNGKDNKNGKRIATPFGSHLELFSTDLDGGCGEDGTNGTDGTAGQNGGLAMLADIRIHKLKGFTKDELIIFGQGGKGYPGGNGGDGGHGGTGGIGLDGMNSLTGPVKGGKGGAGGHGGHGGKGGHGGHGGLASNIFVQIPATFASCVKAVSKNSIPGQGGKGGRAGHGGKGGQHGTLTDQDTTHAASGKAGQAGIDGLPGRSRKGPAIFIHTPDGTPIKSTEKPK